MHLHVADTTLCATRCITEFGNPCTNFCPANVYEMIADGNGGQETADQCLELRPLQGLRHQRTLRGPDHLGHAGGRFRPQLPEPLRSPPRRWQPNAASTSVESRLRAEVAAQRLEFDAAQQDAAVRLDRLSAALRRTVALRRRKLRAQLPWLPPPPRRTAQRGLYLWGGVGRGKTMLMDWFLRVAARSPPASALTFIASCAACMRSCAASGAARGLSRLSRSAWPRARA